MPKFLLQLYTLHCPNSTEDTKVKVWQVSFSISVPDDRVVSLRASLDAVIAETESFESKLRGDLMLVAGNPRTQARPVGAALLQKRVSTV